MSAREPVNWRAFGAEMAAVVLGILIALGLDRTVRWFDIQDEVREARAALDAELADDRARITAWRDEDRCTEARLAALTAWASSAPAAQRLGRLDRPNLWSLKSSAWDVAKAGHAAADIPLRTRLLYASPYDALANEAGILRGERDVWIAIASYGGDAADGDARRALRRHAATAHEWLRGRQANYAFITSRMDELGIRKGAAPPVRISPAEALCAPLPVEPS